MNKPSILSLRAAGLISTLSLAAGLSACSDGGSPEPQPITKAKITNVNYLDAVATGAVALERLGAMQASRSLALPLVEQTPGQLPCPKGGTVGLSRNGKERVFTVSNCQLEQITLISGSYSISYDSSVLNAEHRFQALNYRMDGDIAVETLDGKFTSKTDNSNSSEDGELSVLRNGKTDRYSAYSLRASLAAGGQTTLSAKLVAARFELPLTVSMSMSANPNTNGQLTLTAEDQSNLRSGKAADGRDIFELRGTPGDPSIETLYPQKAELDAALKRART
ncbi:hypothetical protein LNV23_16310 [Paucibacter sp. DJ1R-11]|uniref:hypothetical protein n=1 Tax=Paucibacter sp. DJ1R-11 TaxID=2893556 RepID=UPI0021E3D25A|nr:hypothetical protein [Paucibacter sp. DJ1R-11]MCV2365017.1 hypothetical protein [Paucibacter sp. DJ1R-11]